MKIITAKYVLAPIIGGGVPRWCLMLTYVGAGGVPLTVLVCADAV